MVTKKPTRADANLALERMQQGRVRGRARRSPVVVWLQENRATLERGFAKSGPNWAKLAEFLGEHGILDGDGNPPTASGMRRSWFRIRQASPEPRNAPAVTQTSDRPGFGAVPHAAPSGQTPAPAHQGKPPTPDQDDSFTVARVPRGSSPRPSRAAPTSPSAAPTRHDPDEVIAAFLSRPKAGSIPMPSVLPPDDEEV